ncbi:MAG: hypothetical protein U0794_05055 [Isosphaeraceae bacterium]
MTDDLGWDGGTGEFGLIDWIRQRTARAASTIVGIGDDAAVLRTTTGSDLVVTTDMLMDGRHFTSTRTVPRRSATRHWR